MEYLRILISSLASIAALLIITKLIGYRQLSQMSMFDYINGITFGSIAAEMAISPDERALYCFAALVLYGAAALALTKITNHSMAARRFLTGKPIILMYDGRMDKRAFREARLDMNEFQMQCRNMGYFDLSDVKLVMLESNGKLSVLPRSESRAVTPPELGVKAAPSYMPANVIMDGVIMPDNLRSAGRDERWLKNELERLKICDIEGVFLATVDGEGRLAVYRGNGDFKSTSDMLL